MPIFHSEKFNINSICNEIINEFFPLSFVNININWCMRDITSVILSIQWPFFARMFPICKYCTIYLDGICMKVHRIFWLLDILLMKLIWPMDSDVFFCSLHDLYFISSSNEQFYIEWCYGIDGVKYEMAVHSKCIASRLSFCQIVFY